MSEQANGVDESGFGPWPSEEQIKEHEARGGGQWLAKQGGCLVALGTFRGEAFLKKNSLESLSDIVKKSNSRYWTFCPIDESGDKQGTDIKIGDLKAEDIRALLSAKSTVARVLASLPPRRPDRRVLVVLRGLPGSGKSTVAQAIVDSDPARWVRVSKDDLRQMMVGQGRNLFQFVEDRGREVLVGEVAAAVMVEGLVAGLDVVLDATNLGGRQLEWAFNRGWQGALEGKTEVLVCERAIDVPIEECVARDERRPGYRRVGRAVIERLAATIDVPMVDRDREAR